MRCKNDETSSDSTDSGSEEEEIDFDEEDTDDLMLSATDREYIQMSFYYPSPPICQ